MSEFTYGSVWWKLPDEMVTYQPHHLDNWTNMEVLKMHYYLTKRLDGYGHLTAHDSIKHNCKVFREVLAARSIDGVDNCIQNETFYDWGYRTWQFTESRVGDPNLYRRPRVSFVRIGL